MRAAATVVSLFAWVLLTGVAHGDTTRTTTFANTVNVRGNQFSVPVTAILRAVPTARHTYRVSIRTRTELGSFLTDVGAISAKMINRSQPCAGRLSLASSETVQSASAVIREAHRLDYSIRAHLTRTTCWPLQLSANLDVRCDTTIVLSTDSSTVAVRVLPANGVGCATEKGNSAADILVQAFANERIFKTFTFDITRVLPVPLVGIVRHIDSIALVGPQKHAVFVLNASASLSNKQLSDLLAAWQAAPYDR